MPSEFHRSLYEMLRVVRYSSPVEARQNEQLSVEEGLAR